MFVTWWSLIEDEASDKDESDDSYEGKPLRVGDSHGVLFILQRWCTFGDKVNYFRRYICKGSER